MCFSKLIFWPLAQQRIVLWSLKKLITEQYISQKDEVLPHFVCCANTLIAYTSQVLFLWMDPFLSITINEWCTTCKGIIVNGNRFPLSLSADNAITADNTKPNCFSWLNMCSVAICAFTFGLPAANQHKEEDEPCRSSIHYLELPLLCRATHHWGGRCFSSSEEDNTIVTFNTLVWGSDKNSIRFHTWISLLLIAAWGNSVHWLPLAIHIHTSDSTARSWVALWAGVGLKRKTYELYKNEDLWLCCINFMLRIVVLNQWHANLHS